MKATKVKDLLGFMGDAALYKVEPFVEYNKPYNNDLPAKTTEYVVVSAVFASFAGPETYIFPADKNGEVVDWCELDGSYKGGLNHEKALANAGYEV